MVVAQTNALDEIAVVFGILGLLFFGFSREKQENSEYDPIRLIDTSIATRTTVRRLKFFFGMSG